MNAAEYAALKTDYQKWQQCQDERDKLRTALAEARENLACKSDANRSLIDENERLERERDEAREEVEQLGEWVCYRGEESSAYAPCDDRIRISDDAVIHKRGAATDQALERVREAMDGVYNATDDNEDNRRRLCEIRAILEAAQREEGR